MSQQRGTNVVAVPKKSPLGKETQWRSTEDFFAADFGDIAKAAADGPHYGESWRG
jgi:hypothetical protein